MVFCLVVWFGVNLFVTIFLCSMGAIHQKFARKKVGDTEKRAKLEVHCEYSEMNVVRSFDRKFFPSSDFKGKW